MSYWMKLTLVHYAKSQLKYQQPLSVDTSLGSKQYCLKRF